MCCSMSCPQLWERKEMQFPWDVSRERVAAPEAALSVPHCSSLLDMVLCALESSPSSPDGFHCGLFMGSSPKSICSGALVFRDAPTLAALPGSCKPAFALYLPMLIRAWGMHLSRFVEGAGMEEYLLVKHPAWQWCIANMSGAV